MGKPAPGPDSACLSADAFIPPCGAVPSSFNTNFTISIATWQGRDYEIKITTNTPLVTMFSGGSGLKDKKGKQSIQNQHTLFCFVIAVEVF